MVSATQSGRSTVAGALRCASFVIGGTEKAGTTSVFDYLSAHPQVCASQKKETDFFRHHYTGDPLIDARRYAGYFEHCGRHAAIRMEASPGYLGEAATVAPRMRVLVPEVKLLFLLRDPVDRFYSSYQFHRGRLNLPRNLSFDEYLQCCLDFDRQRTTPGASGLQEWFLRVLRFGCFAEFIEIYRAQLPMATIKTMFFEALRLDERAFMIQLSGFLGIDATFWRDFRFRPSNVTFFGRNRTLHGLAVRINNFAEPMLRRHPRLKQSLLRAYKLVNQQREGYEPMSPAARQRLVEYYAPSVRALQRLPGIELPAAWQYLAGGTTT